MENVDMNLEDLQQLLLRSHQPGPVETGTTTVMDVSTHTTHVCTQRTGMIRLEIHYKYKLD